MDNKIIEEMAKDMLDFGMEEYPTNDSVFPETILREQFYHVFLTYAKHLIEKGYRKIQANEVVRKIDESNQADWLDGYKVGFKEGVQAIQLQSKEKIDLIVEELLRG